MATKKVVEKEVETKETVTADIQTELVKQLAEIKKMQTELLKQKVEFDKEKAQFAQVSSAPTSSNEFIEVICNIPKFDITELGAYDLGTRNSLRFIKLQQYGSRGSIQFSDLQEILGYTSNGLLLGAILIAKKHTSAIKDMGLQPMYEKIIYPEDMDEFLNKSIEEIEKVIVGCPERMKEVFIEKIKYNMSKGMINWNVNKMRKIEEILDVRL